MKKNYLPVFAAAAIFLSGCGSTVDSGNIHSYPFKTAKIEYSISGTTEGKSVVYIKGDQYMRESHIVFHKATGDEKQNNIYMDDLKNIYSINLDQKTGSGYANPLGEILKTVPPEKREQVLNNIAAGLAPDAAATQTLNPSGTMTVAGQQCDVYQRGDLGEICLWHTIPLKTAVSIPDFGLSNSTVAVSIQTDIDLPDNVFEVPAGINLIKIDINGKTNPTQQP